MASQRNGTLYAGITSDLVQRVHQHREGLMPGFTSRVRVQAVGLDELHEDMPGAIAREKQIKGGSRKDKLRLIEGMNPRWRDLYDDLL